MPTLTGQFKVDFTPLLSAINRLAAGASMRDARMRRGMERSGELYLASMNRRFGEMEGGGWRPLARSTVRERVRQGFPGPAPILRRSGELRRGLLRGAPGNLFATHDQGVRVGYGGGAIHSPYPGQRRRRMPTIAQIATFHQTGRYRRSILAPPDAAAVKAMADAVAVTVRQILIAA